MSNRKKYAELRERARALGGCIQIGYFTGGRDLRHGDVIEVVRIYANTDDLPQALREVENRIADAEFEAAS